MGYEYSIIATLDVGKAVDSVGDFIKEFNTHYSKWGGSGELKIRSGEFQIFTLKCSRKLSEEEKEKMKTIVDAEFIEKLPQYDIRVSDIRCKSGKSSCKSQSR